MYGIAVRFYARRSEDGKESGIGPAQASRVISSYSADPGSTRDQDQQAQERLARLRQALVDGEASGEPKPVDMTAIKAAGRKRMKAPE
ncbi:MAG: hypothetical protein ACJATD_000301 [Alloalcanivorax sp.]|jgi:hypothetical protein